MGQLKTIGLVGGVASGKSLVAQLFAELGAGILNADRTGHEVLATDPEVRQAVVARWGPKVLAADGSIDRTAVATRVFPPSDGSPNEAAAADREFLESLLHPRIRQRLAAKEADFAAQGYPAVVLDAPLLLEAGWGPLCDLIVLVDAEPSVRLNRALARGWSVAEFARREAAQWPMERKRRAAHVTLANDSDVASLRSAVGDIWRTQIAS